MSNLVLFYDCFILHQYIRSGLAKEVNNHLLLYRHPSSSVLIPALRTVGNIVTGDDMQTQVLFSNVSCL